MAHPVKLYLIRHGRASAGFAEAQDPGLDEVGRAQAQAIAQELGPLGPLPLVTSPLKRARETAAPFATLWGLPARIEPDVGEIPSPVTDLQVRAAWLRQALQGRWSDLPPTYQEWRDRGGGCFPTPQNPTAINTPFLAIKTGAGPAPSDDRQVCFAPHP